MKKTLFTTVLLVLFTIGLGRVSLAAEPGYIMSGEQPGAYLLTPEELDDLLAPIALYPDPLIAQILPAATFVDQIGDAARHVREFGKSARIDDQGWDVSVKAVAHYPEVLFMMEENYQWTVSLGQAFIYQQQDVMDTVQRLRADARAQGNLYSTREQQVIYETEVIRIVPASPQYVYVPVYDPRVVYWEQYNPVYPFITFSVGFAIGAWLNRDCNWRERRVYYHGWRGGGWVSRARPHIRDRRGVYINRRAAVINTNTRVLQHDTSRFRQQLRTDTWRRREERRTAPPARLDQPRPGKTEQQRAPGVDRPRRLEPHRSPKTGRQPAPGARQRAPASPRRTPATSPQRRSSGANLQQPARDSQPVPPAVGQPRATGSSREKASPAAGQRRRSTGGGPGGRIREGGPTSRENIRQLNRPAPAPPPSVTPTRVAPAPRVESAPAPRIAPTPTVAPPRLPARMRPRMPAVDVPSSPRPATPLAPQPAAPRR